MSVNASLKVNVGVAPSLWQCIKLRIAGKAYEPIAKEIAAAVVRSLEKPNSTEA
jgi:hypothetical protein